MEALPNTYGSLEAWRDGGDWGHPFGDALRNFSGVGELYCHHPSQVVALGANPMSDLKLDSLQIQNFRTFKDLTIDRLGRVNLIVGKNNVGKTALLEALWIWAHDEYWDDLTDQLVESGSSNGRPSSELLEERYEAIRHLIHGRPASEKWGEGGSNLQEPEEAHIYLGPSRDDKDAAGLYLHVATRVGSRINWFRLEAARWDPSEGVYRQVGELSLQRGDPSRSIKKLQPVEAVFVSSTSLSELEQRELWSSTVRDGKKSNVLSLLRAIDEGVKDVDSVRQPLLRGRPQGRSVQVGRGPIAAQRFVVTREDSPIPVPLHSLGEGMGRAMSIGLGLTGGQDGLTLIDEIENGVHYSAQPDMWRMIFETAQELDVQVFATTHSHDCVRAFQQVADDYKDEEGMLIQLRRKRSDPKEIVAVTIDEEELQDALRFQVDPR